MKTRLTATSTACLRRCPRQYHYRFGLGLSRVRRATPLRFGQVFHKGLELRHSLFGQDTQTMDWCLVSVGGCRAAAPASISRPPGAAVIFASRRSAVFDAIRAAHVHFAPWADVMTRRAPSGETCSAPSRKTQNHAPRNRTRSVKALCGAWSHIRSTAISSSVFIRGPFCRGRGNGRSRGRHLS